MAQNESMREQAWHGEAGRGKPRPGKSRAPMAHKDATMKRRNFLSLLAALPFFRPKAKPKVLRVEFSDGRRAQYAIGPKEQYQLMMVEHLPGESEEQCNEALRFCIAISRCTKESAEFILRSKYKKPYRIVGTA